MVTVLLNNRREAPRMMAVVESARSIVDAVG
jgi:hypothetical protein